MFCLYTSYISSPSPHHFSSSHVHTISAYHFSNFHLLRGRSGCKKWQISRNFIHPFLTLAARSLHHLHHVCLPDNKISTHPYVSPSTTRFPARSASWIVPSHRLHLKTSVTSDSHHVHHCTACESTLYILCTEQNFPTLLSHRHHRATFQILQLSFNLCYQPLL